MIEIYGKKNCPQCKAAVELCESRSLDFLYHDIEEENITKEMLVEKSGTPGIRTVPQIFAGRLYLGDLTELRKYLSNIKQLNG